MSQKLKEFIEFFFEIREVDVLNHFMRFKGAHKGDGFVYVPGSRKDRVLLVAHADTVNSTATLPLRWIGDTLMRADSAFFDANSSYQGSLGADDRAGCAMLHAVHDGTHSLLITTGEERGLVGARKAVTALKQELALHQFAIEIDRRGDRHAAFYEVASDEFEKYVMSTLLAHDYDHQSWSRHHGSSTDIVELCPAIERCGVNLSAGYWGEHTREERFHLDSWLHTRTVLKRWLKSAKLEQFMLKKKAHEHHHHGRYFPGWEGYDSDEALDRWERERKGNITDPNDLGITLPSSTSKRQRKRIARRIQAMVKNGRISREQGILIMHEMLEKLDEPQRITEAQRLQHWLGEGFIKEMSERERARETVEKQKALITPPPKKIIEPVAAKIEPERLVDGGINGLMLIKDDGQLVPATQRRSDTNAHTGKTYVKLVASPPTEARKERIHGQEIFKCFHFCLACQVDRTSDRVPQFSHLRVGPSGACALKTWQTLCTHHSAENEAKIHEMEQKVHHLITARNAVAAIDTGRRQQEL